MDIISSIDRFINNRLYHYALLINGSWGSGKTYFIKNTLIPHITSSGKSVNYLSLYGIKSTDEISQILCLQAIKNWMPVLETKDGQIATKVLSSVFKGGMNVIGAGDTGIEGIAELIPNYDNNVIIFDDLERCGCDINEVLGYINNFVEHSDAAVILVANEEEIGKWQYDRNPELQMMIAMDPRVKVDLKPTGLEIIKDAASMNRTGTQAEQQMQEFTIDEIERRRKEIFNSNEAYKSPPEPLASAVIFFGPDDVEKIEELRDIVNNGLANSHPDALREYQRRHEIKDWNELYKKTHEKDLLDKAEQISNIISPFKSSRVSNGSG